MMLKKAKHLFKFLVLPFFPESEALKKYWWHKLAGVLTLIATISSFYTLLWFISLFYINFPPQIDHIVTIPTYPALHFANLFSDMPIYGMLFRETLKISPIGPFTMPFLLVVVFYFLPVVLYRMALFIYHNFHSKKVRVVLAISLIGIVLFSMYIWKFQQVVTEGSLLVDEHCIKVNPLIIDRKNKYTDQYNIMTAQGSVDEYMDALAKYRVSAATYTKEEKIWLDKQRKYLDSKDFNQLMPDYMKEAANHQYNMYEAQYLSSFYLLQDFEEIDKGKQADLGKKVLEETNRSNDEQDKYNAVWEREKGKSDWRFNFVKVPVSKCPAENNDFPEVPNPFAPPTKQIVPNSPLS